MNNILKLKGTFTQKPHPSNFGPIKLPNDAIVTSKDIENIISDINEIDNYWKEKTKYISGIVLSVYYKTIIPKSKRIVSLLKCDGIDMNERIVGARFSNDKKYHIITYYIPRKAIAKSLKELEIVKNIIFNKFSKGIKCADCENIEKIVNFSDYEISKTTFLHLIVDINNINKIITEENNKISNEDTIISIYKTEKNIVGLMDDLEIKINEQEILGDNTVLLGSNELKIVKKNIPYLVAMELVNVIDLEKDELINDDRAQSDRLINKPTNEPIIGVIDKPFKKGVYFDSWVEDTIVDDIKDEMINNEDYWHGTGVSSIIVDGPRLNPSHDDGCGHFRVRHFGVAVGEKYSSFKIIKSIEEIVSKNTDIKVWNLSLGSKEEIKDNYMSFEGAFLDELQNKYDILFIVAGTNKPKESTIKDMKIGAPADSLNSLVVNSVNNKNEPASYTRNGKVLSFYIKPDVSYFGGDDSNNLDGYINVCNDIKSEVLRKGTSYAAPWITRKIAYLIYILGFSKEEAKAIIIDSAEKWEDKNIDINKMGHGVVPTHINDIVQSPNDEIKFVISGISEKYDTYNYQLPIPMDKGKYPFVAKATMCYFPICTRNQGVDYTNTELELKFGRLKANKKTNEYNIQGINNDVQDIDGTYTNEVEARNEYRKWDNTKCIKEKYSKRSKDKIMYENPLWGISVKTKNRINPKDGDNLKFGIVITLKEIHGKNRINEFIQQCSFNKWFVDEINIQNKIDIYNIAEEEITFEK